MDIKEIRESGDEVLQSRALEISEEIFRLRCVAERMTPQRGGEIRVLRREHAKVQTVLRQRSAGKEASAEIASIDEKLKSNPDNAAKLRARRAQVSRTVKEMQLVEGK